MHKSNPDKRKKQMKTLKEVLQYIKHYRLFLVCSIFCAGISVALSLYNPILIGEAVDLVVGTGKVDFAGVFQILVKMGTLVGITAAAQWIMNLCNNKISYNVIRDMRQDAFKKIQILPFSYIDSHPYGQVVSKVIADADQFSDGLLMGFTQLFTGILTILGTLLFMFFINPVITAVVVVLTPLSLLAASFIASRTYRLFRWQSEARGDQTGIIDEMIGNQKVVKAFAYEEEAQRRFDQVNERLRDCSMKATFYSSLTNPCTRFVNSLVYAAVGIFGAVMAAGGKLSVGQLVSFLSYANQYTKPFNEISGVVTELQNALACADSVLGLVKEKTEVPEDSNAWELREPDGTVEADHVWFSYTPEQPLIENFNLKVEQGQRIAIVGPTGCGKSTVINLLMRFYDVQQGSIRVSGRDVRSMTRSSLRSGYGMVLQETWLRSGTIRENIVMGKPEATEEEMIAAAKAAHAHSFIKRLPRGYDTVISEDGGILSQGQKQLLCITRVMLCLPPMLILDEATSSIDIRTEQKIQNAFARMMQDRTSFIVAHRLSTIREADVILVMRDGHIVEQGNHESLMACHGFYEKLYNSQFVKV